MRFCCVLPTLNVHLREHMACNKPSSLRFLYTSSTITLPLLFQMEWRNEYSVHFRYEMNKFISVQENYARPRILVLELKHRELLSLQPLELEIFDRSAALQLHSRVIISDKFRILFSVFVILINSRFKPIEFTGGMDFLLPI